MTKPEDLLECVIQIIKDSWGNLSSEESFAPYKDLMVNAVNDYTNQFNPKWISVKDQLPKHINLCLIFKEKSVGLASYSPKDNYWILFKDGKAIEYTDITHWMNLPEPPCK